MSCLTCSDARIKKMEVWLWTLDFSFPSLVFHICYGIQLYFGTQLLWNSFNLMQKFYCCTVGYSMSKLELVSVSCFVTGSLSSRSNLFGILCFGYLPFVLKSIIKTDVLPSVSSGCFLRKKLFFLQTADYVFLCWWTHCHSFIPF